GEFAAIADAALLMEHGLAPGTHGCRDAALHEQAAVKRWQKHPCPTDVEGIGHGYHTMHPSALPCGGNRGKGVCGCSVDHGRLAGVEDHDRDAIFAQQGAELVSTDRVCSAGLGFKEQTTLRAFQAIAIRGNTRAVAAMTIEMDNVIIARTSVQMGAQLV